ncbi:scarecrow-like protein 15 [Rutidosis leptorrhynchoides]|uniref:scarecrow-like protein 15 n=1 Tax=Rutidosis leptorrhynchoides TaxID=125765 RepID=UPI003A9920C2
MKLPFVSSQNNLNSPNIKQVTSVAGGGIVSNRYEPKSVLDVQRSPTNSADRNTSNVVFDQLGLDNNNSNENGMIHQFEEWDSLMKELGLHDDSTKSGYPLDLPELPPIHTESAAPATALFFHSDFENLNPNLNALDFIDDEPNNNGYDYVDELIRIAECFETRSIQLAQVILARLNQRLRAPTGKPLQRAAFYFKEALQSLLTGPTRMTQSSSSLEIVQAIKAYKTFSNVSPIPMFSDFTSNQAMLEAVDGAMIVHVIDFDIGLGGHLASFMKEIAEKSESRKVHSPAVRITAIVPEEYEMESKLIRENLWQFARNLKLRFDIEFVSTRTFEYLSFKSIKFMEGEKTAVLLSSTVFHRLGAGFVNDMRAVSPQVVVCVDGEGAMGGEPSFFRQTVIDGLEFYSTLLESLEAANGSGGGGSDWIRKIEMFVLLPKITAAVEASGRQVPSWHEVFGRAGMKAVGMSQFADFQAECLLKRVQVRGFHVVKRQAEMVLCWHDRPLVATSAWRF